MKDAISDVLHFHALGDVPVVGVPKLPARERIDLRRRLLEEEFNETIQAMDQKDLIGVADGLADIIYIAIGTALEFGIPLKEVWDEVHASNMAKVDGNTGRVMRRPDGKVLKPEGWRPPHIQRVLLLKGAKF